MNKFTESIRNLFTKTNWEQLGASITENVIFVLEFVGIIVALFAIAYVAEWLIGRKKGEKVNVFSTRKMCIVGLFSAVAYVLILFDFALPFAPSFYKIDASELPVLIVAFAYGPVAGVMTEFIKIFLKILTTGTSTAFVGELANFAVGCSMVLPASILYETHKKKKIALIGCIVGTICMTIFGTGFNAIYLLPKYAQMWNCPVESFIAMGTAINSHITNIWNFVFLAVAPLNLLKGTAVSLLTMVMYKPLSPIIKFGNHDGHKKTAKTLQM